MKITLRKIDQINQAECESLQVSKNQNRYIVSNADSLTEAAENAGVARPFAIYSGDKMVGFTMFAFDENNEDIGDRYWLWRFMIDASLQGKGYGSAALKEIIRYFNEHGADQITLSTKESNTTALRLYHRYGFKENGDRNEEEIVLKLHLHNLRKGI